MTANSLSVRIGDRDIPNVRNIEFIRDVVPRPSCVGDWVEYEPRGSHIMVRTGDFPINLDNIRSMELSGPLVVGVRGSIYLADDCRCTFVEGFCDGMGLASSTFAINDIQGGRFDEPSQD